MCGRRHRRRRPAPPPPPPPQPRYQPPPPPPPPPPAPAPPPPPRRVDNFVQDEGGTTFKPGKKRKKDRAQAAKGTGQLRIPRTGAQIASGDGGGPVGARV